MKQGDIILQAAAFEEFIETVELDVRKPDSRGITGSETEAIRDALVFGIRDYARKNSFTKAVLGLSGGIDSTLVAALTAEAIGAGKSSVRDDAVAVFFGRKHQRFGRIGAKIWVANRASNRFQARLKCFCKQMNFTNRKKAAKIWRRKICNRVCAA